MEDSLSIATEAASEDIVAAAAFYGMPHELEIVKDIQSPLPGPYSEDDHGIPPERVFELEIELKEHNIPVEIHISRRGYGFFNDTRP